MSTCDLTALLNSACANKFSCTDQKVQQALQLQLLCEIKAALPTITKFDSGQFALPAPYLLYSGPHGLGGIPTQIQLVTVANAVDATINAPIGTEIDYASWWSFNALACPFTIFADTTNIIVTTDPTKGFLNGNEVNLRCGIYSTGVSASPSDVRNFDLRIYALRVT